MVIGSSAGASYYQSGNCEIGITGIPQVDIYNPKVISQGPSVCIFNNENPQEVIASWLFVEFLTTNVEFQAELSMTSGYIPVIKSATEHPIYEVWLEKANGYNNVTALAIRQAMEQMDAYYASPAFHGSSIAREVVLDLMFYALIYQGADLEEYLNKLFEDAVAECEYRVG
jgi:multiple sugar transport system substrate-binding protein